MCRILILLRQALYFVIDAALTSRGEKKRKKDMGSAATQPGNYLGAQSHRSNLLPSPVLVKKPR
jgi:hypothetical protein